MLGDYDDDNTDGGEFSDSTAMGVHNVRLGAHTKRGGRGRNVYANGAINSADDSSSINSNDTRVLGIEDSVTMEQTPRAVSTYSHSPNNNTNNTSTVNGSSVGDGNHSYEWNYS